MPILVYIHQTHIFEDRLHQMELLSYHFHQVTRLLTMLQWNLPIIFRAKISMILTNKTSEMCLPVQIILWMLNLLLIVHGKVLKLVLLWMWYRKKNKIKKTMRTHKEPSTICLTMMKSMRMNFDHLNKINLYIKLYKYQSDYLI